MAAKTKFDLQMGWWADPIFGSGDYPLSMKLALGQRMPLLTQEEKNYIKGSSDFYGLNHYTAGILEESVLKNSS